MHHPFVLRTIENVNLKPFEPIILQSLANQESVKYQVKLIPHPNLYLDYPYEESSRTSNRMASLVNLN